MNGPLHRIPWKKEKNAVSYLEISTLLPEIFKLKKCVKYVNEMIDDIITTTTTFIIPKEIRDKSNILVLKLVNKVLAAYNNHNG